MRRCAFHSRRRHRRQRHDEYRMHTYLLRLELEPRELALELLDVIFRTHRVTQWR